MPIQPEFKVDIETHGNFFRRSPSKTIRENAGDAVEYLGQQGRRRVGQQIRTQAGTGFTAHGIDYEVVNPRQVDANIAAFVRLRAGLSRGPGSAGYPPSRVPYIVNHVLETGHYRGGRLGRKWVPGMGQERKATHHFETGARILRAMARRISWDLTKGLR